MPALRLIPTLAPDGLPLTGRLLRAGLARTFGGPSFSTADAPGDPGLLGPDSASWPLIAEPAAIVGGVRALLVQLLHPLAMAGVADHSRFRDDALGRLQRTSAYVTATTFGATAHALAATAAVRRAHRRVVGVAPDGQPYRADDPHLLAWVSVALTSSFLATDRLYAPTPLTGARADAFVAEQSLLGALLDPAVDLDAVALDPDGPRRGRLAPPMIEDGTLPMTVAALDEKLAAYSDEWEVNAQGVETLRFLVWPNVPGSIRAGYLPLLAGAVASLEPQQRRTLRIPLGPGGPAVRLQTRALVAAMRLAGGVSPALHAARKRAAAARAA